MLKKIYDTTIYIIAIGICLGGLISSRDYLDRYLAAHDNNKLEGPGVNYSMGQHFSLGMKTMISDILLIKIITSYPMNTSINFLEKHNKLVNETSLDLKKTYSTYTEKKKENLPPPKPQEPHKHHSENGLDEDGHDHNNALDKLLMRMGFYMKSPEEETAVIYDATLIKNIYQIYDLLISLDPKFYDAYNFAFSLFSLSLNQPDYSEKLLRKGLSADPGNKHLCMLLATNAIFFSKDTDETRNELLQQQKNTSTENAIYIAKLIITLEKSRNPYYVKFYLLKQFHDSISDETTRKKIENLMVELLHESTLMILNKATPVYMELTKKEPTSALDIANAHIMDANTENFIKNTAGDYSFTHAGGFIYKQTK